MSSLASTLGGNPAPSLTPLPATLAVPPPSQSLQTGAGAKKNLTRLLASLIDEEYVDVKSKSSSDPKIETDTVKSGSKVEDFGSKSALLLSKPSLMRTHEKVKGAITVKLVGSYSANFTSGANQNFFGLNALGPVGVQDWSSFGAVYDLARVKSVTCHIQSSQSAASTNAAAWAMAFDPFNPGAYASFADVLTAKNVVGPVAFDCPVTGTVPVTKTGFYTLRAAMPAGDNLIQNNQVTGAPGGGGWFATSTTSFTCGYLKSAQQALGSGITSGLNVFVVYEVEFRNRT